LNVIILSFVTANK